ncbi:MAG TPA: permease-like cell division protein FtsX [Cyclobacteriaceae bacterium]|nr:permease-like cell division protein FtsX [Cyclobacteriaceae bacterium]
MSDELKYKTRKKLGSYPYISVLLSISVALFVIGLLTIIILQTNQLISLVREKVEVQVFLDKNITENDILRVRNVLSNSRFVIRTDGQADIQFIPRDEAAEIFIRETGENFKDFLDENPLRDAYIVHMIPEYQHPDSLARIGKQLESVNGVYEVEYMESLIESINRNIAKITTILLGIAAVMLIVVIILINNTIKLAMYSQRFLIRSMQLVGATTSFIQWPFLSRSIWHGFLSGIISSTLLYSALNYADKHISGLSQLIDFNDLILVFASVTLLGILIAFFSTYRAINKYINLSLDELY